MFRCIRNTTLLCMSTHQANISWLYTARHRNENQQIKSNRFTEMHQRAERKQPKQFIKNKVPGRKHGTQKLLSIDISQKSATHHVISPLSMH